MSAFSSILQRQWSRSGVMLQSSWQVQRRAMSMFLWRHVPIYRRKDVVSSSVSKGWRLQPSQTKPAQPVRVEGVRPTNYGGLKGKKVFFTWCVISPDGNVHPFRDPGNGSLFVDFWNEKREIWRQSRDYEKARGVPEQRYCPRCDGPMNWLRRVPINFTYKEVIAKRQIYRKVELGANLNTIGAEFKEGQEDLPDDAFPMEDRYCCPNDECGIREARVEFSHNTAKVIVIEGLTDKQWHPTRFGAGKKGREKQARAKARLAEIPFDNRGHPIQINGRLNQKAPFLNEVTHEEAIKIVEQKATARYKKKEVRFNKRPDWYRAVNNFRYLGWKKLAKKIKLAKEKSPTGNTPCDECGETIDPHTSSCFSCGFVLCEKCRRSQYRTHPKGAYLEWCSCPGCGKKATSTINIFNRKKAKQLEVLIQKKSTDRRRPRWMHMFGLVNLIQEWKTKHNRKFIEYIKARPSVALEQLLPIPPDKRDKVMELAVKEFQQGNVQKSMFFRIPGGPMRQPWKWIDFREKPGAMTEEELKSKEMLNSDVPSRRVADGLKKLSEKLAA